MKNIDIINTLNSGQVFLWKKINKAWYGIDGENIIKIIENPFQITFSQKKHNDFFRKKDNRNEIINNINKDEIIEYAINKYPGLRLLNQDPFQCIISFITSSNSNIQKIKYTLQRLCKMFGNKIEYNNMIFYTFPKPSKLANARISDLLECGVGYRAKYIKNISNMIYAGKLDLENLRKYDYHMAKYELVKINGIGDKIADCVLLFSLDKLESFPIDRWMLRILQKYYSDKFQVLIKKTTTKKYIILHDKIIDYFGKYAGYAQQFLFKMERDKYKMKWIVNS